jgi:predicted CxxxxCH...CXXCH cytochrome family protein
MSQIKKSIMTVLIFIAGVLLLAGCGDPNSKAPFSADSGHPAGWFPSGHAAAAKADPESCTECHGSDLSGGTSDVACSTCHVNGSPIENTNCTSCHGNPPSGTVDPNRAGAHNSVTGHFNAQVTLPDACNTCHNGAGSGTLKHDNGTVDVSILASYNAKSGTAVHNADGTCSEVSCHGGQTTPVWNTGSINVKTQCTLCHVVGTSAGTPEYNSPWSGRHDLHVNTQGIACTACHDTAKLAVNHFTTLDTPALEGPASATIGGQPNTLVTDYTGGNCTNACHVTRSW